MKKLSEKIPFNHPLSVRHNGRVVILAIAAADHPDNKNYKDEALNEKNIYQGDICYRVLNVKPEIPEDDLNWTSLRKLYFPNELRPVGMDLILTNADKSEVNTEVPFQSVSDGKHVYIFQQSMSGTLLVTRFLLIDTLDEDTDEIEPQFQSPWEVRYQRSQKKVIPASLKDSPGFKNMEDEPFIEPTFELSMIKHLIEGRFSILTLPTNVPNQERWQIFAYNGDTLMMDAISIPRSENGLFLTESLTEKDTDGSSKSLIQIDSFKLKDWEDNELQMTSAPGALLYMQQETEQDAYGRDQMLKRNAKVMFAVGADIPGTQYETNGSLLFDGIDDNVSANAYLDTSNDKGICFSTWVKFIDIAANSFQRIITIQQNTSNVDNDMTIFLEINGYSMTYRCGAYSKDYSYEGSTSYPIPEEDNNSWVHLAGVYQPSTGDEKGNWILYRNGIELSRAQSHEVITADFEPVGDIQCTIGGGYNVESWNPFEGKISEVNLWQKARTGDEILASMEQPLVGDETDLIAYWKLNEGIGTVAHDHSTNENDGTIIGGSWSLDNPLEGGNTAPGTAVINFTLNNDGVLQTFPEEIALSFVASAGDSQNVLSSINPVFLDFAHSKSAPFLADSVDGRIHLYFQGEDNLFSVAQYDTQVSRVTFELPLQHSIPDIDAGSLKFISRQVGPIMNDAIIEISDEVDGNGNTLSNLCAVSLKGNEQIENWRFVPRDIDLLLAVLNGQATDDPIEDALIRSGKKTFYAYHSNRALYHLPLGGGLLAFVSRKTEVINNPMSSYVMINDSDDGNSEHCMLSLSLSYLVQNSDEEGNLLYDENGEPIMISITKIEEWKNLPRNVADFIAILNGVASKDAYAYVGNTSSSVGDDLRGGSVIYTLASLAAEGEIIGQLIMNNDLWATTTDDDFDDLSLGSALFSIQADSIPNDGSIITVDNANTDNISLINEGKGGRWEAPIIGYALDLDGYNYVSASPALLPKLSGDFTLESWVQPQMEYIDYQSIVQVQQNEVSPVSIGLKFTEGGNSLAFDGETAVVFDEDQVLKLRSSYQNGGVTLEARIQNTNKQSQTLFEFDYMELRIQDNRLCFIQTTEEDNTVIKSKQSDLLTDGNWHWISCCIYQYGGTGSGYPAYAFFYIDGQQLLTDGSSTLAQEGDNLKLEFLSIGGSRDQFDGLIDEVRLWSKSKAIGNSSEDESIEIINILEGDEQDLWAWYPLNEGTGTQIENQADDYAPNPKGSIVGNVNWNTTQGSFIPIIGKDQDVLSPVGGRIELNEWNHLAVSYRSGYAIEFEGVSSNIDCSNNESLNSTSALTLEAWINAEEETEEEMIRPIASKINLEDDLAGYELFIDEEGFLVFRIATSPKLAESPDAFTTVRSSGPIPKETWHYIAASFSATSKTDEQGETITLIKIHLFINGKKNNSYHSSEDGVVGLHNTEKTFFIGQHQLRGEETENFMGQVDEVRVWTRALDENEIETSYESRKVTDNQEGLAAYWQLQEGEGTTAYDAAGINHGKISSSELWQHSELSSRWGSSVNGKYINQFYEQEVETIPQNIDNQLSFGTTISEGNATNGFNGQLDEIRIWETERSPEQISDNRYKPLFGTEEGLIGYWKMDDSESENLVTDLTINNNHASLAPDGQPPEWILATSPIKNESAEVKNVLDVVTTGLESITFGRPAAVEYGDMQRDQYGNQIGIMKRCYAFKDEDGFVKMITGYKAGDLEVQYIGQVQTDPTLIGFIEGAPPVPSENLTVNDPKTDDYVGASWVELVEAQNRVHLYSSSREGGKHQTTEYYAGGMVEQEVSVSVGTVVAEIETLAASLTAKAGYHSLVEESSGTLDAAQFQTGSKRTINNKLSLVGNWEGKDQNTQEYPHGDIGQRYVPSNVGYALVKSHTSDLYALRLKKYKTLVAYQVELNPDIPEDWNIIMFPIDPKYTKNGTLDGKVGFDNDESYPDADQQRGSYFKPKEAYSLKAQIEHERLALEAYYEQIDTTVEDEGDDQLPIEPEWQERASKRSIVNTYVWTADGGLYAEEEEFMTMRQESIGGNFKSTNKGGLYGSIEASAGSIGGFAEYDALSGSYINLTSMKTKEESQSFGIKINVDGEGFISKWDEENQQYNSSPQAGKVDTYRFMTFYITPKKSNYDTFFDKVVDEEWLRNSNDANAQALRAAQGAENGVWRVFHRVTYVSRVPEAFQSTPQASEYQPEEPLVGVDGNLELIDLIEKKVSALIIASAASTPDLSQIQQAVDYVLNTELEPATNDSEVMCLTQTIAWWKDYWLGTDIGTDGIKQTAEGNALRQDIITYMKNYFEIEG